MHFSKTYTQLLLSLPPELRDNAIEYRQLKKIINQIVNELSGLGLKPAILHELIEAQYQSSSGSSSSVDGLAASSSGSGSGSGSGSAAFSSRAAASVPLLVKEKEGDTYSSSSASSSNNNSPSADCDENGNVKLSHPRVVYELNSTSGKIEPQLRIWIGVPAPVLSPAVTLESEDNQLGSVEEEREGEGDGVRVEAKEAGDVSLDGDGEDGEHEQEQDGAADWSGHASLLWAFQQRHFGGDGLGSERIVEVEGETDAESEGGGGGSGQELEHSNDTLNDPLNELDTSHPHPPLPAPSASASSSQLHPHPHHPTTHPPMREIVVPLIHDTEFYNLLSTKLESISAHLTSVHGEFMDSLQELSRMIADTAHPASVAASFRPTSSVETHAGGVRVRTGDLKSDLYFWREIFQMYVEAEVFESVGEVSRGERSVEESERRLQLFAERATKQGLGDVRKLKLKQSREALERFLKMNLFILDIKKFSHANSEATRKILKKHTKRTALFYPGLSSSSLLSASSSSLIPQPHAPTSPFSFPRILVQAIGATLLPVIPSLEDYSCLICTSIAFKPIRLDCGHLFCVRCLVKMQKRGKGECPCCRRLCVLGANRKNVDWALLNFMQDWFPVESKEKLKHNEKEAAEEEMRELGIDPDQSCVVM